MKYVYAYLDPRKPKLSNYCGFDFTHEPFYIGEGCGDRMFDHLVEAKKKNKSPKLSKIRKIQKLGLQCIIVNLINVKTGDESLALESKLIKAIGTIAAIKGVKRGPLTNLLVSEEGVKKRVFSEETIQKMSKSALAKLPMSKETKVKISVKLTGKKQSTEHAFKRTRCWVGRAHKPESIEKMKEFQSKRPSPTLETRLKISEKAQKSQCKTWIILHQNGEQESVEMLKPWCVAHSINYKSIRWTLDTDRFHKGFRLIKIS